VLLLAAIALPRRQPSGGQRAPVRASASTARAGFARIAQGQGRTSTSGVWCKPCAVAATLTASARSSRPGLRPCSRSTSPRSSGRARLLSRRPVGYPSLFDPDGKLPTTFGVETMPTSFLIDRQGVIRRVHRGFRKEDVPALRAAIQELVRSGR
jgi:hypothetical protein